MDCATDPLPCADESEDVDINEASDKISGVSEISPAPETDSLKKFHPARLIRQMLFMPLMDHLLLKIFILMILQMTAKLIQDGERFY